MGPSAPWSRFAASTGGGVRREAFFFPSGSALLYASLYDGLLDATATGVVVCPSWGVEGQYQLGWCHRLAQAAAERGGAGLVVHWPGWQDSTGDPGQVSFASLVESCCDAAAAGRQRCSARGWVTTGIRLGAAVAAVAAVRIEAPALVMAHPALDPAGSLTDLGRFGRRGRLGQRSAEGWVFGHPVPPGLTDPALKGELEATLGLLGRKATIVRYDDPSFGPVPGGVNEVLVPGLWRRPPTRDRSELLRATVDALLPGAVGG
jgi:hypothetical protein